jgi:hypothetical protein
MDGGDKRERGGGKRGEEGKRETCCSRDVKRGV